jgi:nicotinamidase/pyrazinamidase
MSRLSLIVVDVQRDFCPGGSLAVGHGDEIIPNLNRVIDAFNKVGAPIFLTRDWHPPNHCSFKSRGGIWPSHCVRGTPGAEFHQDLHVPPRATIINKAIEPDRDAYSGFDGTDLTIRMRRVGVIETFLGGLATDYCVKETTLDALKAGFVVDVMLDCVRGVNIGSNDSEITLQTLVRNGARQSSSQEAIDAIESAQQ